MSRRGWVLFWSLGLIWGMPYFFISVAVDELAPAVVVFGRTSLSALVMLYLAGRSGGLRPALREWRWVATFAIVEMAIPWILLATDRKSVV